MNQFRKFFLVIILLILFLPLARVSGHHSPGQGFFKPPPWSLFSVFQQKTQPPPSRSSQRRVPPPPEETKQEKQERIMQELGAMVGLGGVEEKFQKQLEELGKIFKELEIKVEFKAERKNEIVSAPKAKDCQVISITGPSHRKVNEKPASEFTVLLECEVERPDGSGEIDQKKIRMVILITKPRLGAEERELYDKIENQFKNWQQELKASRAR